jgi:uncharacterized membrane protein YeiH
MQMPDPNLSITMLILILDLFGIMAFAVTGTFKAIEHKSDRYRSPLHNYSTCRRINADIIFGNLPPTAVMNSIL